MKKIILILFVLFVSGCGTLYSTKFGDYDCKVIEKYYSSGRNSFLYITVKSLSNNEIKITMAVESNLYNSINVSNKIRIYYDKFYEKWYYEYSNEIGVLPE